MKIAGQMIWSLIVASRFLHAQAPQLDAAERRHVIDSAIANLKHSYVDPDVAQKMAEALLAHEKSGDYNAMTEGAASPALLAEHPCLPPDPYSCCPCCAWSCGLLSDPVPTKMPRKGG